MRATQFIASAFTLAVAALSLPAMSTPVKFTGRDDSAQSPLVTCNEGLGLDRLFPCSDATAACERVPNMVSISEEGGTAQQLASSQSATVYLTRAKSSTTNGNATALCLEVVGQCCAGGEMSKGEIALPFKQKGSIQIVASS